MKKPNIQTWGKLVVGILGFALILWLLWRAPWFREMFVSTVGRFGTPAIPVLRNAMQDEDHKVRDAARQALRGFGADAVPSLIASLDDADAEVRIGAARALYFLAEWSKDAAPSLIEIVKNDPDANARREAVTTLGLIGCDAQGAIPALLGALKEPVADVRKQAALALGRIGRQVEAGNRSGAY